MWPFIVAIKETFKITMKSQVPFCLLGFLVFKAPASELARIPAKWLRNLWVTRIEGERRNQSAPWANIYSAPEAMREGSGKGVQ